MLVAQYVEPLRDPQIEGLPCELVAPVCLLVKETHVFHFGPSLHPEPTQTLALHWANAILIRLMQPRIAFEILPFLPRSPFLSPVLPPSSFARALSLVAEHLSLPSNEVALDVNKFLRLFDANDFLSKVERI
jgi:hypothetical protein